MKRELIGALALGVAGTTAAQSAEQKPNLVIFISDDCSYTDIGCYGVNPNTLTPNIDKFASESVMFTHAYQAAPMSSPTRHNLYTGVWPVKSGAYPNHTHVEDNIKTITHHLPALGYKVALFGKSHVGPNTNFKFDLYVPSLVKNGDFDFNAVEKFVEECRKADQPYCMIVATNQPHTPWRDGDRSLFNAETLTLPPMYVDIPETREQFVNYLAEVNYMDDEFGRILKMLDKKKQSDNSVVVFLSEQGNSLPFAKWTCYDVGVRSAYLVRWGDKLKPRKCDAIVEYLDVVPTFIDFAGGQPDPDIDGKSIKPLLLGEVKKVKDYTFSLQTTRGINGSAPFYGIRTVSDGRYRYIMNCTPDVPFKNGFIGSDLWNAWVEAAKTDKFAAEMTKRYQYRPAVELYDTEKDIWCMNNIAGDKKYAKKLDELAAKLKEWMDECGDKGAETEMEAFKHMGPNAEARWLGTLQPKKPAPKNNNKKNN